MGRVLQRSGDGSHPYGVGIGRSKDADGPAAHGTASILKLAKLMCGVGTKNAAALGHRRSAVVASSPPPSSYHRSLALGGARAARFVRGLTESEIELRGIES